MRFSLFIGVGHVKVWTLLCFLTLTTTHVAFFFLISQTIIREVVEGPKRKQAHVGWIVYFR